MAALSVLGSIDPSSIQAKDTSPLIQLLPFKFKIVEQYGPQAVQSAVDDPLPNTEQFWSSRVETHRVMQTTTSWQLRVCRVAGLAPVDVPPDGRVQLGRWLDKGNLAISRVQAVVTAADGGLLRFESLEGTNPSWMKTAGSVWQSISRGDHIVLSEESQIALHEQQRDGGNTLLTLAAHEASRL